MTRASYASCWAYWLCGPCVCMACGVHGYAKLVWRAGVLCTPVLSRPYCCGNAARTTGCLLDRGRFFGGGAA